MRHFLVSIPNDAPLAERLGKKGSVNGLTFYNRKIDDCVFVVLTPTNPETKFNAVAETITLSDNVLVSTSKFDRLFAESIIGCSVLGKNILLTGDSDASAIMQQSKIEFKVVQEDQLFEYLKNREEKAVEDKVVVEVDKAFEVKGIGTVVLGIVKRGKVKVHDSLFLSIGKSISVRSIQTQDQDVQESGINSRVGLAIKGLGSDDIEKGELLSDAPVGKTDKLKARIKISGMVKEKGFDYNEMWFVCGFRSSICKVAESGDSCEITLSAKLPLMKEEGFLLVRKQEPRIFAGGTIL